MHGSRPLSSFYRTFARRRAEVIGAILALAVCLPALFGERWYSDTGLYAAISAKAAREGHWWTLQVSDSAYFNKPPLAFWIHGTLIKLFELFTDRPPPAWVIHLPEVLAVMGTVILAAWIMRKLAGPRAALFTAVLLPCMHPFVFLVDSFRLDHLHTFLLFAALALVVGALKRAQRGFTVAVPVLFSGVPIGLALLVKPLWSLLFFVVVALWLATLPRTRRGTPRRLIAWFVPALIVALAVAAPWYLSMRFMHGEAFIHQHFKEQALDRGLGTRFEPEPWWWYLHYLAFEAPAWTVLALAALMFRPLTRRRLARDPAAPLLCAVWIVYWLAVLSSFADKRRYWLTHAYPMFAMLAGLLIARLSFMPRFAPLGRWLVRGAFPAACAILLASAALSPRYALVPHEVRQPAGKPEAYWREVEEFLIAEHSPGGARRPVYSGSLHYNDAARLYVTTCTWPKSRNWSGLPFIDIPPGSLVMYDTTNRAPPIGEGAEVVMRSGRIVIVLTQRLDNHKTGTSPAPTPN